MELLQLRYFMDSAHLGSIVKTADKYNVPASSVSAAIRRLEKELGQPLFDRSANRILLNSNGQKLCKSLEQIFSQLDGTVNDIIYPPDNQVIRLLVLAHRLKLTNYIIEYRQNHPSVIFDACINYDVNGFSNYDIIISPANAQYTGYESFELYRQRIFLRTNPDSPLLQKELTLSQLRNQPFVTMGGNMHEIIVAACERAGYTPNVIARINDTKCYLRLLSEPVIGHVRLQDQEFDSSYCLNVTDFNEYQSIRVYYKETASGNIKSFLEFLKLKSH